MNRPPSPPVKILYRRLPGRWYGVATKASVWLGPDHLLVVERAWFIEHYRRLRLRDIESIVVQHTRSRAISAAVALFALLLGLTPALLPDTGAMPKIVGSFITAVGAIAFVVELARGAGRVVTVRTRTSSVRVRAWSRARAARRGVERLCEEIAKVQPPLTPEMLVGASVPSPEPSPAPAIPPALPPAPPPRAWAAAVGGLLAAEGAAAIAALATDRIAPFLGFLAISAVVILVGTVVILAKGTGPRSAQLRHWSIAVISYWAARGAVLYALWFIAAVRASARGNVDPIMVMPALSRADGAVQAFVGAIAAVSTLLALFGTIIVRQAR